MALDPEIARYIRMGLSSLANGVIGASGILLAAATGTAGTIPESAWLIAGITGVMLCAKDIQAYLSQPPVQAQATITIPEQPVKAEVQSP